MGDIIPYLEEANRRCASGAPMRIEPKNARKTRNRSVGRCHRAHGKPLRGIDGVKYPVGTMHGMPKEGEDLRFNYVSFRDDNVRVDHKWTDGRQRYSVSRNPDARRDGGDAVRYSVVRDGDTLAKLNGGRTIRAYRAMQLVNGRLYPPMAAKVDGKWQEPAEIGEWLQADERPDLVDGRGHFKLNKGNGSTIRARYNPYWHTSLSMLNDQFSSAKNRPNLVTVEVEVPEAELTSGYRAKGAKDAVGKMKWHSGPVSSRLAKLGSPREVILSRWCRVVRIVPDAEVADAVARQLDGTEIAVPENTVTPSLYAELRKRGVATVPQGGEFGPGADIRYSVGRAARTAMEEIADGAQSATIENAEVGKIGYPLGAFGEMTDGGRIRHGIGFLHIVYSRMAKDGASLDEAVSTAIRVAESAANGEQTRNTGNRIWLDKDGIRAVVARNADGQKIITGYEIYAEEPWTTSRANHGRKRHPTPRLDDVLSALRRSIAYLAPEAQAPTPDAFVRDAVMGMLVAAGDGNGAADAEGASGGRPTPERASVRRGVSPVRIDDLAVGTLAQRILAGKDPTVDDARKFLDGFGLSRTLDAGAALRAAREIAEANRERLKGEVERANPEVIGTLARANLSREMRSAMDSLVTGAARAVDPEVGMRLKDAVASRDRRALMAAKGFTAAEEARRRDDAERKRDERRDGEDADGGDYI